MASRRSVILLLILAILFVLVALATLGGTRHFAVDVPVRVASGSQPTTIQIIDRAAADEGVSPRLLRCIAFYESSDNPFAVSWSHDYGLFQFHRWPNGYTLMESTPWHGQSVYSATASAHAAAYLIKKGYGHLWSTWWLCN